MIKQSLQLFLAVGISLSVCSIASAQEPMGLMDSIKARIDKSFAKKYDGFGTLTDDETLVKGMYKSNCDTLKAEHCHYIRTSYLGLKPPSSRPEQIQSYAKKACKKAGGKIRFKDKLHDFYRTHSVVTAEETNAAQERINLHNWLVLNFSVPSRQDFAKPNYYSLCTGDNGEEVFIMTSASTERLERDDQSMVSLTHKGDAYVYISDYSKLTDAINSAGDEMQACMSKTIEPGDMVYPNDGYIHDEGILVVEIKGPVAFVQGEDETHWVKLDELKIHKTTCE